MDEAWRLTFEYEGERLKLKKQRRIAKRVPRGQTPDEMARRPTSGGYVELRDAEGALLYRRRVADLIPTSLEYPTGDPEQPLARTSSAPKRGIVSVLVPVRPGGTSVALVASRDREAGKKSAAAAQKPTRDLIVVELDQAQEDRQ